MCGLCWAGFRCWEKVLQSSAGPCMSSIPQPQEGKALQLPVLPRTWEVPLLGQLKLFQLCCGCTLGLSCPLISPEAPPKSCDLESSKHPPALCSGHPTHLPDTWHCSRGLAEGKHCTGTWWNLISGLHILAFGFESNALPVKWPLERSILGTPDLEPWLKCPSGVCGESFMELNYITRLLSPWTRVHAAPTN